MKKIKKEFDLNKYELRINHGKIKKITISKKDYIIFLGNYEFINCQYIINIIFIPFHSVDHSFFMKKSNVYSAYCIQLGGFYKYKIKDNKLIVYYG